jgi:hypothetical protein
MNPEIAMKRTLARTCLQNVSEFRRRTGLADAPRIAGGLFRVIPAAGRASPALVPHRLSHPLPAESAVKRRIVVALRPVSPVERLFKVGAALCRRMEAELEVLADPTRPDWNDIEAAWRPWRGTACPAV